MQELKLGMKVYHEDVYHGRERMKVVGLREHTVELEGDYSGGTHNVCQKDWESRIGVLLQKNSEPWHPMQYNECKICGAGGGRAGLLIGNESLGKVAACLNCNDTRESGKIVLHSHLVRTEEEIRKTFDILKTLVRS